MPGRPGRGPHRRAAGWAAAGLAVAAGVAAGVLLADRPHPHTAPTAPAAPIGPVTALLDRRAAAVRHHDEAAFLATVDPTNPALRRAQATLFADVAPLPLGSWSYRLPAAAAAAGGRPGTFTPAAVVLDYTLAGFDTRPERVVERDTFVRRSGRWYLGAVTEEGRAALWERGPLVVRRSARVLVLGHPAQLALVTALVGEVGADIPHVTAVWGPWRQRAVVVVPSTTAELADVSGATGDLSNVAALATAELSGSATAGPDRIYVNPIAFAKLSAAGRAVVLTHELTHLAARTATGPDTPDWLLEGFADYVGFAGSGLPVPFAAQELAAGLRHGLTLASLPPDTAFAVGGPGVAVAYEEAWLACRMVAQRDGQGTLVALYRRVGGSTDPSPAAAVEAGLAAVLHESLATFTAQWRAYVHAQLGA